VKEYVVCQKFSTKKQLSLAELLQRYWSDNKVSSTITFEPKTEGMQLQHAFEYFHYQLKGISFLPRLLLEVYAQMQLEATSERNYHDLISKLPYLPEPSVIKPPRHAFSRNPR
jgi:ribonucleoside-triphosphate reductase